MLAKPVGEMSVPAINHMIDKHKLSSAQKMSALTMTLNKKKGDIRKTESEWNNNLSGSQTLQLLRARGCRRERVLIMFSSLV